MRRLWEMAGVVSGGENVISSESRPPNPLAGAYRQCFGTTHVATPCKKSLVRHASLVKTKILDVSAGEAGKGQGRL